MLDYVAEQKKSKGNMMEIFREYAALDGVSAPIKKILHSIISEIVICDAYDAFYGNRKFPSKTVQFVFFMLHAIYQHGGGTYETLVGMAHSIRKIVEIKTKFVESVRFSALLMVISPLIFTFSVMMISFMTFGVPEPAEGAIALNITAIRSADIDSVVESLKPVTLVIAITGGLGVSKTVHYSFLKTQYLFLATVVSSACLFFWESIFGVMQSLV